MLDFSVLKKLRSGERCLEEVTDNEFENVVAALVAEKFKDKVLDLRVLTDRRYVVDVVLQYTNSDPLSMETPQHFIEAKNSSGNLPLDRVAKAYCAALRYAPLSLTLASHDGIAPQAIEYAKALFSTSPKKSKVHLLRVRNSINNSTALSAITGEISEDESRSPLINIEHWEIWKNTTFTSEKIACTKSSIKELNLSPNASYILRIYFSVDDDKRSTEISVTAKPESFKISEHIEFGDQNRIELMIENPANGRFTNYVEITAHRGTRSDTQFVSLPRFQFNNPNRILPILRGDMIDSWSNRLLDAQGPKILFVRGEAGVGKTYFCEQISNRLSKQKGYEGFHFAIESSIEDRLFYRIFTALVFPRSIRPTSISQPHQELTLAILESLQVKLDTGAISDDVLESLLNNGDPNIFLEPVARFIANRGQPVILVLTNCQRLSPIMVRTLLVFFTAMETHGWNNIRVLCEFRDTADDYNSDLVAIVQRLVGDRLGNAEECKINVASNQELEEGLSITFPNNDARWMSNLLIAKTGGNPLFLEHLLQYFLTQEVIKPQSILGLHERTFRLTEGVRFNRSIDVAPASVSALLEQRLSYFDTHLEKLLGPGVVTRILGLSALQGLEIPEGVGELLELSSHCVSPVISELLRANILTQAFGSGRPAFAHEMIRIAARESFKKFSYAVPDCERLIRSLQSENNVMNLLIQGDVQVFIGRDFDAKYAFSQAFELCSQEPENFLLKRRSLKGLDNILRRQSTSDENIVLEHLDILLNLGWTEHNAGSSKEAQEIYKDALDTLIKSDISEQSMTQLVVSQQRSEISRKLFGVSIYRMDIRNGPEYVIAALRNVVDFSNWGRILNRLILFCHITDQPEYGLQASQLALKYAQLSDDPEVFAVLCTDIGDLYQLSNPSYCFELHKFGVTVSQGARQKIHNDLCAMTSEIYTNNIGCKKSLQELESRAKEYGVYQVLGRLSLIKGIHSIKEGDLEAARQHFLKSHHQAVFRGHWLVEVMADNNLMLLAALRDDYHEMRTRASSLLGFCQEVDNASGEVKYKMPEILKLATDRAEKLLPEWSTKAVVNPDMPPLPEDPPWHSAWQNVFTYNLTCLPWLESDRRSLNLPPGSNRTVPKLIELNSEHNIFTAYLNGAPALFAIK